ncbi:SAV0927 family protein [Thalassobacillus devorans]|uniref:SAV0927 family protein n=1 Tax=Thalassobacillus devorans TaxID=279813 RepID=UPI000491BC63|nr:SAV0927 family protein [Thalassobacillus devorans]
MELEYLFEEVEEQEVRYTGIVSNDRRYDIGVVRSRQFLGKSLVFSLQNQVLLLMSKEDINDETYWSEKLGVYLEDIDILKGFFRSILQPMHPSLEDY